MSSIHSFSTFPKVLVYFNGGLGNQMFQYSAARSLALSHNAELVLDSWSGFVRDNFYRRQFMLNAMPIQGRMATSCEQFPIWLYRWSHRDKRIPAKSYEKHWYGEFITELPTVIISRLNRREYIFNYQNIFQIYQLRRLTYMVGYWQSPKYFEDIHEILKKELMPPDPTDERYLSLGFELQHSESVALGVRLYEESMNPSDHAFGGHLKEPGEIQHAISRMRLARPYARFYVFCTHRAPLLAQLDLPCDTVFVTSDDGYNSTLETLWLLTRCQHHIFTNSSYYWWGAWLSAVLRGRDGQKIIAADNFINQDCLCSSWERF